VDDTGDAAPPVPGFCVNEKVALLPTVVVVARSVPADPYPVVPIEYRFTVAPTIGWFPPMTKPVRVRLPAIPPVCSIEEREIDTPQPASTDTKQHIRLTGINLRI
jgi:hypothetical protein